MTKTWALEEYYIRRDKLQRLEITRVFIKSNIALNRTNPAMVAEFTVKLAETEKEISKLIAEA